MCPGLGEWWLHKGVLNLQNLVIFNIYAQIVSSRLEMYRSSKYELIRFQTDLLKTLLIPIRYTDTVKWLPYTAIVQHIY